MMIVIIIILIIIIIIMDEQIWVYSPVDLVLGFFLEEDSCRLERSVRKSRS